MPSDFMAQLQKIADAFLARRSALAEAVTPEVREISKIQAQAHGAQHFANLLEAGYDQNAAMGMAVVEADRHEQHLLTSALQHADPQVEKRDLFCAVCKAATPHACVSDSHGELIATCSCGRWQKIPQVL